MEKNKGDISCTVPWRGGEGLLPSPTGKFTLNFHTPRESSLALFAAQGSGFHLPVCPIRGISSQFFARPGEYHLNFLPDQGNIIAIFCPTRGISSQFFARPREFRHFFRRDPRAARWGMVNRKIEPHITFE